jgi:hypothetical protein
LLDYFTNKNEKLDDNITQVDAYEKLTAEQREKYE